MLCIGPQTGGLYTRKLISTQHTHTQGIGQQEIACKKVGGSYRSKREKRFRFFFFPLYPITALHDFSREGGKLLSVDLVALDTTTFCFLFFFQRRKKKLYRVNKKEQNPISKLILQEYFGSSYISTGST